MSARVTSITHLRARARRRDQISVANSRLSASLLAVVGILTIIGLGATMSASSVEGILEQSNHLAIFKRQVMWVVAGMVVLFIATKVPYRWYAKMAFPLLVVSTASLILVEVIGVTRNNATRWIIVGDVSVQPSEASKFAVIVFLAAVLAKKGDLLADFRHFVAPMLVSIGLICFLVIRQPDLGTSIVIAAGGIAVLMASQAPWHFVAGTAAGGATLATLFAIAEPYRRARLSCFLDPLTDPLGDCYQLVQSLLALGSGNVVGVGLGASRARWSYLPNAHTDFIYTIIAEETGFIGAVVILVLFAGVSMAGVMIAHRSTDPFARLLAVGITAWLTVQALINIGGVVGVLPITGMALPFVSVGGSAMLTAMGAIGVLINIAQYAPGKRSTA